MIASDHACSREPMFVGCRTSAFQNLCRCSNWEPVERAVAAYAELRDVLAEADLFCVLQLPRSRSFFFWQP